VVAAALAGLALLAGLGLTAVAVAVARFADTTVTWSEDRGPMMRGDGRWDDDDDDWTDRAPGRGNGNGNGNGNALPRVGALHGEYTATVDGASVPMLFQTGTVTALQGAGGLTVRSTDGFTATYARTADTVVRERGQALAPGATVTVLARKQGASAVHVWVHRSRAQIPAPAPTPSPTATP
jgi:hypothetical protein